MSLPHVIQRIVTELLSVVAGPAFYQEVSPSVRSKVILEKRSKALQKWQTNPFTRTISASSSCMRTSLPSCSRCKTTIWNSYLSVGAVFWYPFCLLESLNRSVAPMTVILKKLFLLFRMFKMLPPTCLRSLRFLAHLREIFSDLFRWEILVRRLFHMQVWLCSILKNVKEQHGENGSWFGQYGLSVSGIIWFCCLISAASEPINSQLHGADCAHWHSGIFSATSAIYTNHASISWSARSFFESFLLRLSLLFNLI